MTTKERDDLVSKLYKMMNPIHIRYNSQVDQKNYGRMLELCKTLSVEESRAVNHMLVSSIRMGESYLRRHHKFLLDSAVSQDIYLESEIRHTVFRNDNVPRSTVEVEKEVKKELLNAYPMI